MLSSLFSQTVSHLVTQVDQNDVKTQLARLPSPAAYGTGGILVVLFVLGLIRKIIVLAIVAGLGALAVIAYQNGLFDGLADAKNTTGR